MARDRVSRWELNPLKTFAYCCQSFKRSVSRAAGVDPVLCPPVTAATFQPAVLEAFDFLYFKLHGLPGEAHWYGDNWITALSAAQLQGLDLSRAVVFAANCFLAPRQAETSPMLHALLTAGAKAVIGGPGENLARARRVDGADLLGHRLRLILAAGASPQFAFHTAMTSITLHRPSTATHDTLAFHLFTQDDLPREIA